MSVNDSIGMKITSGTCNICSAPCSSFMHELRSSSVIGSTSDSGCSGNICSGRKGDIRFPVDVNGTTLYKGRRCDDSQNTSSETSNILAGMSSSHNSYSENAESKSTLKASAAHDLEDLEVIKKEKPLKERTYQAQFSADPSGQGEEQLGLECHGDNISCITGGIDANISDYGDNLYLDKKDMNCGEVLTNSENEAPILAEAEDGPQVPETEEGDNSGFPQFKVDFSNKEGNLNMKTQSECMNFAKMDAVESSLGSFSSVSSAGRKHATLLNVEVSTTNEARSFLSFEKSKVDDLCQEVRTYKDSQISSDNGSKSGGLNEALEMDNAFLDLEAKNRQGYDLLPLANTEIENTESTLYDVKVCDICGDAGREALLAICSSCSDGAEHTYCMLEKLDELPGADWLCEECKIKEMESDNVDKSETLSGASKPAVLFQSIQNSVSTSIPKKLAELDAGILDLDVRGLAKGLRSPKISTRRHEDHVEETKVSIKNQKIKVKKANMESSEGHFSRSVSFSNSIINQNVKQVVKNDCYEQKIEKEAMSLKPRNENLVKSINKSIYLKNSSAGFSDTEPASNDLPFHPSRIEIPRGMDEVKERFTFEKKNPPPISKTSIRKSAAPANICHFKTNRRPSQKEENLSIAKRSYDASYSGFKDRKKQISHSSKSMEFLDEKFNSENCKRWKVVRSGFSAVDVLQPSESDPKDNKIRDSDTFLSPRLSSSGDNQTLQFQKCNKIGQATQQCSTDELQGSAYRPSGERSLRETMKKGKECKDLADARVPKTKMINEDKNFDKLPLESAKVICDDDNGSLKFSFELGRTVAATDSLNLALYPTESLLVRKANPFSEIPTVNESNEKSLSETLPGEASTLASRLRALGIPKLEFIWQGSFNVLRSDRCLQLFDGIQAHLSTSASHEVVEISKMIPKKMMLEEVSQTSLRALQFQGVGPNETNIALLFFAKDNESYEKSYSILLNKMLKNDLALKGKVDEAELFVLTSKMLPVYSQRWNMLYYLWGMFIGKRKHCLPAQEIPLFIMGNSPRNTAKAVDVIDNPELQLQTSQLSYKLNIGMGYEDKFLSNGKSRKYGESPHSSDTTIEANLGRASPARSVSPNCKPVDECNKHEYKKRKKQMSYYSIGSTFGEENLSSPIFSQQQHTHNISSEPVIPEISRIVERNFFPVHIAPLSNNRYGNPAHIPSSIDCYNSESCTPDLELTLGNKSKITKPAPLLPLLPPSVPFGSGDGDDLSALLSL